MLLERPTLPRGIFAAALVVLAASGAFPVRARFFPSDAVLPGLRVAGAAVPEGADPAAFVAERAKELLARRVELHLGEGGESLGEATLAELGVRVDEAQSVARAVAVGHAGDWLGRAALAGRARRGAIDVPLAVSVDGAAALAMLERVKAVKDVAPISARLDLARHDVVPERDGRYVDVDAAISAIARLVGGATRDAAPATLTLPLVGFPARMSSEYVRSLDVHAVLSSYDTYFSRHGDQSRRGQNIDVAASKLDGLVLSPGELVSFNQVVGERSEENGFQRSWEIFKGEMKEGVGGGTCQVASTLYAASFFAGIEILERLPHSRPSAYIPMGLDATVVYPVVDMKLRNPHPFPVVVHALVDGNRLHVELLGASKPVHVEFKRELVKIYPYGRKVEEKRELAAKRVLLKQHGLRGFRIKRERVVFFHDGKKRTETNEDFYPPTTEIYDVPRGFDVALLPPLPVDQDLDPDSAAYAAATAGAQPSAEGAPGAAGSSSPLASSSPPGSSPAAAPSPPSPTTSPSAPASAPPSPSPSPASVAAAPAPCAGGDCVASDVKIAEAPGAHPPSTAQMNPPKTLTIKR